MPPADKLRRYAILEHHWNGIHWDFLIEDGPDLKTWAIDAPIVHGIERGARLLPPHRRDYLDYEGAISGNRGSVRRWDAGIARIEVWTDRVVRLRVQGSQLDGLVDLWVDPGADEADGARPWRFRFGKLS